MAVPSIVVVLLVMGSTVIHFAGEVFMSSLATVRFPAETSSRPPRHEVVPEPVDVRADQPRLVSSIVEPLPISPIDTSLIFDEINQSSKPNFLDESELVFVAGLPESEQSAKDEIVEHLGGESQFLSLEGDMWEAKSAAREALKTQGIDMDSLDVIGIIDYTKPSYLRRFSLYYPASGKESRHLVSHGKNSGELYARSFSNRVGSYQSSGGLFWVGNHYRGSHGQSIRLHGMEPDVNDNAFKRAIVIHSAWYVSYDAMVKNLDEHGVARIGCSHGCPAFSRQDMPRILDQLKEGTYVFAYTGW